MVPIPYTLSGILFMLAEGTWLKLGPYLVVAAFCAVLLDLLPKKEVATLD